MSTTVPETMAPGSITTLERLSSNSDSKLSIAAMAEGIPPSASKALAAPSIADCSSASKFSISCRFSAMSS